MTLKETYERENAWIKNKIKTNKRMKMPEFYVLMREIKEKEYRIMFEEYRETHLRNLAKIDFMEM